MKNGKIKIESGIPMPKTRHRSKELVTMMLSMKVGDSFLYPLAQRSNLGAYGRNLKMKFSSRAVDEEHCRVWRIE